MSQKAHQMGRDELPDPFGGFLAHLGLQLDFEYAVREELLVILWELVERPVDSNIHAPPVVPGSDLAVPIVFADERELSVERDTDTSVSWKLEGGPVVERADD